MLFTLLALQEILERADREFRPCSESLRVDRVERRGDAFSTLTGRLHVGADRELRLEGRGLREEDLPGLDVWRRPWSELRRDYALSEESPADPEGAVRGEDGNPIAPLRVRLRPGPAVSLSAAPERRVFVLSPVSGGFRLKVWFDDASLRAERVAWETRTHAVAVTLGGGGGSGPAEGPGPRMRSGGSEDRR